MLFCPRCEKEVVHFGVSPGAMPAETLAELRRSLEAKGKLVLFNAPPVGPYTCPRCGGATEDR